MRVSEKQLREIIALADDRLRKEKASIGPEIGHSIADFIEREKTPEGKAYQEAYRQLRQYINMMSYDVLIEVETLMVYGRQWHQSVEADHPSVKECFLDFKSYVGKPDGKEMAVIYITEKAPLGDYLRTALMHCDPSKIELF